MLGTIESIDYSWNADRTAIFTYVALSISDQFKGESVGSELVVQIPGGTVHGMTQTVSDTPRDLAIGMQVIVHTFIQEKTGYHWIYGWEKGILTIENNMIPEYRMSVDQFHQLVETVEK